MHAFVVLAALLTGIHAVLAGAPSKIYGVNLGSWLGLSHIYAGLDTQILFYFLTGSSWKHGCFHKARFRLF